MRDSMIRPNDGIPPQGFATLHGVRTTAELRDAVSGHRGPELSEIAGRLHADFGDFVAALGVDLRRRSGQKCLDCRGGRGIGGVGHNHPRLVALLRSLEENRPPERGKALSFRFGSNPFEISNQAPSAVEARRMVLDIARARANGRALAVVAPARNEPWNGPSLASRDELVRYPFGDVQALARLAASRSTALAESRTVVLFAETIACESGVLVLPPGTLSRMRRWCDEVGALFVVDETELGYGTTGAGFAFERDGITPDVLLAGSGTRSVWVVTRSTSEPAAPADPALALWKEARSIVEDDGLLEHAARVGEYLQARLDDLQARFSDVLVDVRGRGLLAGLEVRNVTELLPGSMFGSYWPGLRKRADGALAEALALELLVSEHILVGFLRSCSNVLRIQPALVFTERDVDELVRGLTHVLERGTLRLVWRALENKLR